LSTAEVQTESTSSWKQEISLRIAAHKSRRGCAAAQTAVPTPVANAASSRAAEAAARVAARYAKAPSYSQMLSVDAFAATNAGEVASAPNSDGFAAVTGPRFWEAEAPPTAASARSSDPDWEPALPPLHSAAPSSLEDWESECAHNRWEPDLRLRPVEALPAQFPASVSTLEASAIEIPEADTAPHPVDERAASALDSLEKGRWEWPELARDFPNSEEIKPVEPDLPIPANLIEFPRELVATRRMRPRRAEGPFAVSEPEAQLSIFEVDPRAVSTCPEHTGAAALAAWPQTAWAEIELEPQVREETEPQETPAALPELQLAPMGRRMVAALADGALIAGIVLGPALAAAGRLGHSYPAKILGIGAAVALIVAGMLYFALSLLLAGATAGMKLAGISLCTFDGQIPTRAQLRSRLGALLLSLVPVGLGIAWSLFDDDHLSWHDRLSRTYLREN